MISRQEELDLLKAYLTTMPDRAWVAAPPTLSPLPFEALPPLDVETQRRIRVAAFQANDRYVQSFLEEHSICPFSRGGRMQGQTARYVHFVDSLDPQPFVDLMARAASDPSKAVVQIILPMISVDPKVWCSFSHQITAAANARLPEGETYAVAPLHPTLPYKTSNCHTLIPLFRRSPDPTIQWVRLDALKSLYAGRGNDDTYVSPDDMMEFMKRPRREPLFDRIADTNMKMAQRLGISNVEQTLHDIHRTAQAAYTRILLGDEQAEGCPFQSPSPDTPKPLHRPPASPVREEEDGRIALVALRDLPLRSPVRFAVEGIELVVVRTKAGVQVLYGRCSHRRAPLDAAIVEHDHIVCPYHGWDYRLKDGQSDGVPGESVHHFASSVEEGLVWVAGDEVRRVRGEMREVFNPDDIVL